MSLALIHHRTSTVSRSTLMRSVDQGKLLRLRPGVFVETWAWLTAKPWGRHSALAAAVGLQRPDAVFCRQTALALYGVPLLSVPDAVHVRAFAASESGAVAPTAALGKCPGSVAAELRAEAARREDAYVSAFTLPRMKRCMPPVPPQYSATDARKLYRSPETGPGCLRVPVPGVALEDGTPAQVRVEPLPFALLDTLPRIGCEPAVVALDAVLAGRYEYRQRVKPGDVAAVEHWLWSQKARRAWEWALGFANPLSESPGESRSRVLIHGLGFVTPTLQRPLRLSDGSTVRVDFEWEADGVAGEFDGRIKFTEARRLSGEAESGVYWNQMRREEHIRDTGRKVARWSWQDLDEPRRLELKLLREGVTRR